jgi:hypothetical protein
MTYEGVFYECDRCMDVFWNKSFSIEKKECAFWHNNNASIFI